MQLDTIVNLISYEFISYILYDYSLGTLLAKLINISLTIIDYIYMIYSN